MTTTALNKNLFFLPDKVVPEVDILLVSGDAYIDHPSFGVAIIARVLENEGFSVAILSQPDYQNPAILDTLPEVRLFIGIASGNIDSIVSNYTSNRHKREEDNYSINGEAYFPQGHRKKPDRASILYTSFIKRKYKNIPIILGGIEASLRRFSHYDFVQQKLRLPLIADSKANLIVYGMGEKAIIEVANRLRAGEDIKGIKGTTLAYNQKDFDELYKERNKSMKFFELPSHESILQEKKRLIALTIAVEEVMTGKSPMILYQKAAGRFFVSEPPQKMLSQKEMDALYALPFRRNYPDYATKVPAFQMIEHSITAHRGCYGRCSFCAIASHQGPMISSRSQESILKEAHMLTTSNRFQGIISDIGGPTANSYASYCSIGGCKEASCLFPQPCTHLVVKQDEYVELLKKAGSAAGVKKVHISSGLRFDLLLLDKKNATEIIKEHIPGQLKIAPEHVDAKILKLMRKPPPAVFEEFVSFFRRTTEKYKLKFFIVPYIIINFPGTSIPIAKKLAHELKRLDLSIKQYQDFTPTPGTLATAMYYARETTEGEKLEITEFSSKHNKERSILEKSQRQF